MELNDVKHVVPGFIFIREIFSTREMYRILCLSELFKNAFLSKNYSLLSKSQCSKPSKLSTLKNGFNLA